MSDPALQLTRETLQEGTRALRQRDRRLRVWIDRVDRGDGVSLRRQRPYFVALCRSIISQQLASKAAATIYARFRDLFPRGKNPDAATLLNLREPELRACGLSRQKTRYLRALAEEFHDGKLGGVRFSRLSDEEVVQLLTELPGIGVWTAEMFLIFALGRLDIFSVGDLALRTGVQRVAGKVLTAAEIEKVANGWSPYRSVASLYLWKVAHWKE